MSLNKVILLGDCGVGKTTILNNFLDINTKTETTIGVQHHSFIRNNIKFSIWDTAGQEKYRSIVSSHYKRAKAAILVYDCSNEQSLLHLDKWIEELVFQAGANVKIALIGNKTDIQSFDMNEHVQRLTEQYDISYQIQTNHKDLEFKEKMNQLFDQISISTYKIYFLCLGLILQDQQNQSPISNINLNQINQNVEVNEFNNQNEFQQIQNHQPGPIEVSNSNTQQEAKSCEC